MKSTRHHIGALAGLGVSQTKAGKHLLVVHGTDDEISRARQILDQCDCDELNEHLQEVTA